MKKNYQKNAATARTPVLPEAVSVAMAELAGDVQEGLLAMAVGTGTGGDGRDDERRRRGGVWAEGPP